MFSASRTALGFAVSFLVVPAVPARPADGAPRSASAQGTIVYGGATRTIAYAFAVKGPDAVDEKKAIRRLVLSAIDVGPKIAACSTMACVDGSVTEGMEVDLDAGQRLNYWVALVGQRIQYSGTAIPEAFAATANDGRRIAGRLSIDDSAAGGPKIDATFDAAIGRALARAR